MTLSVFRIHIRYSPENRIFGKDNPSYNKKNMEIKSSSNFKENVCKSLFSFFYFQILETGAAKCY